MSERTSDHCRQRLQVYCFLSHFSSGFSHLLVLKNGMRGGRRVIPGNNFARPALAATFSITLFPHPFSLLQPQNGSIVPSCPLFYLSTRRGPICAGSWGGPPSPPVRTAAERTLSEGGSEDTARKREQLSLRPRPSKRAWLRGGDIATVTLILSFLFRVSLSAECRKNVL